MAVGRASENKECALFQYKGKLRTEQSVVYIHPGVEKPWPMRSAKTAEL
jgi:hypothetical protein